HPLSSVGEMWTVGPFWQHCDCSPIDTVIRRSRNETTGTHTAGAIASRRNTAGQHAPHLQPALIEFNGEGRARVEVSWISMIHFSRPSPVANAAKSAAPRLMLFEPAPVA